MPAIRLELLNNSSSRADRRRWLKAAAENAADLVNQKRLVTVAKNARGDPGVMLLLLWAVG